MTQFDPFRLDTVNQCLWRRRNNGDEERVLLPPKAYGVLLYLIEHAGRLVTQDELLDAVWPETHIQPEGLEPIRLFGGPREIPGTRASGTPRKDTDSLVGKRGR
jgi:hypothetical protein